MKPLFFWGFIIFPIIMLSSLKAIKSLYYFEKVTFPNQYNINKNIKKDGSLAKHILIINTAQGFGGGELYSINMYKNLTKDDYNVQLLVAKNSVLEQKLLESKISYYAYNKFSIFKKPIQPGLYSAIYKICEDEKIDIIHCNGHSETAAAKKVSTKLPVKTVFTRHISNPVNTKSLKEEF